MSRMLVLYLIAFEKRQSSISKVENCANKIIHNGGQDDIEGSKMLKVTLPTDKDVD